MNKKAAGAEYADNVKHDTSKTYDIYISIGKITKNIQFANRGTGWSEVEKECMSKFGYDGVDMISEWYS